MTWHEQPAAVCYGPLVVPVRLPSLTNLRLHWRAMQRLKTEQKRTVAGYLVAAWGRRPPPLPAVVTLTRLGPRALDGDNLQGACKYVRDSVAVWMDVDDGDGRYDWQYRQRREKGYGVEIVIEALR